MKKTKYVDPHEVFRRIMRPKCFGKLAFCTETCEHTKDCGKMFWDREWLREAIEKKKEHERKAKYFEKRIDQLRRRGVTLDE